MFAKKVVTLQADYSVAILLVERRTDVEDEYNTMFNEENPEELW